MYEIKLGLQALLRNRKRTFTTIGIIVFLISFVVLINAIMYTNSATRDLEKELWYGSWSHAFTDESDPDFFEIIGTYYKITDSVGSFDDNMFELSNFEYYKGRKPQNENEVIITLEALNTLGISYELNQNITIDNYQFEVVGIIYPYDVYWIWTEKIDYPSIITTNMASLETTYFGKATKLTPLYNADDYVAINTYAYPFIEIESEAFSQRYDEASILNEQSMKLTQVMLVLMMLVLLLVFKNNAKFYQKRFEVLSQQGITRLGLLKYILPQLILYAVIASLSFYVIHLLFEFGSIPITQIRYANNMGNLHYASIRAFLMIVILHLFSFILERLKIQHTIRLRFVQNLLVFIVSFSIVYIVTPQTITLHEERIPEWETYNQIWEENMVYVANGSLGGVSQEENYFTPYNTEWVVEDFEVLLNHPKTKYLYYWNVRYPQFSDEEGKRINIGEFAGIHYFNDDLLNTLELANNVSDDFLKGNSFYIYSDDAIAKEIEIGDVVDFNGSPFKYEKSLSTDETQVAGRSLFTGILVSEAGAKRLNLPTDEYNVFRVDVEKMSDFIEYDALVRSVSGKSFFNNFRLNVERAVNREKGKTIFMTLEILIHYSLGLAILALLFLQRLMAKRRTMAIYHFLGESKTKMIFLHSTLFVIPTLTVILPAILIAERLSIQSSSLVFSFIIGLAFVFVLWIVCLLIHIHYFKGSLFELLDERE